MKAILVIDVPQEDIGKSASIMYLGHDKFLRSIEFIPIQPMPMKRETHVYWKSVGIGSIPTHEISDYDKGWNDCVELLENADEC